VKRRRQQAGFTLVELMVALSGGLFVTMAVFVLSKQATSLYQSEARLSTATLGSIVGFERLRADIERAGFLTSPNVARDPKVCGVPDAQWPAGAAGQNLRHLSSIWIEPTSTSALPQLVANGIAPDQITLAGSYASADQFPTRVIENNGTNNVVTLDGASAPLVRLGYLPTTPAATQRTLLLSVFGIGRILRIVDTMAREQYGTILDVVVGGDPQILVSTSAPPILYGGTNTQQCGIQGIGKSSLVNVVNLIRYSLRDMTGIARYAPLFGSGNAPPTDAGRTELVREELDASGNAILDAAGQPATEIISEFAVDLSFGVTVSQIITSGSGTQLETLTMLAAADRTNWVGPVWGANPATAAGSSRGPQLVRAVRARLSVRSREADRLGNVQTFGDGGTAPVMGGLYRFRVPAPSGAPAFARVRTVQTDIAIRSHRGATWL
jgi:type II secretory pathway pseudopilin PulG